MVLSQRPEMAPRRLAPYTRPSMVKLIVRPKQARQPTQDDIDQAIAACKGDGITARSLAGRSGMPLKTAMAALAAAQQADPYIKTEWVPLKGEHCLQHLLYRMPG